MEKEGSNLHLTIQAGIAQELKIDQSVAHNGVCLTVVSIQDDQYVVTAIEETLKKSNLGHLKVGDPVNLERSMKSDGRLDGHIVQGHVDTVGNCEAIQEVDGSWYYKFSFPSDSQYLIVDKGSICVNGVSLTVVDPTDQYFSVAIIPYTYEHTNFHNIKVGDAVNLEFDIIGKYLAKYAKLYIK
jgi:riboflavin synthase